MGETKNHLDIIDIHINIAFNLQPSADGLNLDFIASHFNMKLK